MGSISAQLAPYEEEGPSVQGEASEELPEFPGGVVEMMKFVKANIKYPKRALESNISGKCALKFTVNADGSISDIMVLKSTPGCPECDEEAIRVVKSMPKWSPGKLAGKPVPLFYNLPVNFTVPAK
jgi:protein TonB